MKTIPDELKVIKNSLNQKTPFLILLEITLNNDAADIIYLVRNTEDVTIGGKLYTAFSFELDMNKLTSSGEIPSLKLKISNQEKVLQGYLEDLNGMVGSSVKLIIVNSVHPDLDYTELEQIWDVAQCEVTEEFITFRLSLPNLLRIRYPLSRFIANHCNHKFRSVECAYVGVDAKCKRTLKDCKNKNNSGRFGGFPGLSSGGVRVV